MESWDNYDIFVEDDEFLFGDESIEECKIKIQTNFSNQLVNQSSSSYNLSEEMKKSVNFDKTLEDDSIKNLRFHSSLKSIIEKNEAIEMGKLLEKGFNINLLLDNTLPLMLCAISNKSVEIFTMLLENGADPNYNYYERTYGFHVINKLETDDLALSFLKVLSKFFIDLKSTDKFLMTCLHYCSRNNYKKCAKFLIEIGHSIDDLDINNWTPLMHACSFGHLNMVALLLVKKADTSIKNNRLETAQDVALKKGQRNVYDLIERFKLGQINLAQLVVDDEHFCLSYFYKRFKGCDELRHFLCSLNLENFSSYFQNKNISFIGLCKMSLDEKIVNLDFLTKTQIEFIERALNEVSINGIDYSLLNASLSSEKYNNLVELSVALTNIQNNLVFINGIVEKYNCSIKSNYELAILQNYPVIQQLLKERMNLLFTSLNNTRKSIKDLEISLCNLKLEKVNKFSNRTINRTNFSSVKFLNKHFFRYGFSVAILLGGFYFFTKFKK